MANNLLWRTPKIVRFTPAGFRPGLSKDFLNLRAVFKRALEITVGKVESCARKLYGPGRTMGYGVLLWGMPTQLYTEQAAVFKEPVIEGAILIIVLHRDISSVQDCRLFPVVISIDLTVMNRDDSISNI